MERFKRLLFAATGFIIVALTIDASNAGQAIAQQAEKIIPVLITNTADRPVPVTGSVSISTSGTTPLAVQQVGVTKRIFRTPAGGISAPAGQYTLIGDVDVSQYSQIRLQLHAKCTNDIGSEASFFITLVDNEGSTQELPPFDNFQINCGYGTAISKTYDIPGRILRIQTSSDNSANPPNVEVLVWGR